MTADFSAETKQARRKMEYSIYKVPKRRRVTMRILYSAKLSFKSEVEIKTFAYTLKE